MIRQSIAMIAVFCVLGCSAKPRDAAPSTAANSSAERERIERASLAAGPRATTRPALVEAPPRIWPGLDLSKAPMTVHSSELPEIWEERPPGSRSYNVRPDVTVIRPNGVATVYWVKERNRFYVQYDSRGSSTLHFYGPFEGNPRQTLGLNDRAD